MSESLIINITEKDNALSIQLDGPHEWLTSALAALGYAITKRRIEELGLSEPSGGIVESLTPATEEE